MKDHFKDAHNDVARIYNHYTQETFANTSNPEPAHHLVDAVLTLATVIRAQDYKEEA